MPVITISRGSYSHGREVAEKLAARLGYGCLSREIILEASKLFNIPEMTLVRAVHDAPTAFDRFSNGKQRYVSYFREAILNVLQTDRIVYHGLGGHYFVNGIPHVLKVRILADMEDRIAEEMRCKFISAQDAKRALLKDDEARLRWGYYLFGVDTTDSLLYDLALNVSAVGLDQAVEILAIAAKLPCFQTTAQSRKAMRLCYLAARLQNVLMNEMPSVEVSALNGEFLVVAGGHWSEGRKLLARVGELIDTEKEQVRIKLKLSNR
ncbi:MAG: AAA family ATPase [Syntrophobacteraceae bacterium]